MDQPERQFSSLKQYDEKTQYLSATVNNDNSLSITRFEHLSNELIYEIFDDNDDTYLNAERWQQLIQSKMPQLRTFDFQHLTSPDMAESHAYHALIKRFNTSFWFERQWYFAHRHFLFMMEYPAVMFYSTKPYRRNGYELYEPMDNDICSDRESNLNLSREIVIWGQQAAVNCFIKFYRVTSLVFMDRYVEDNRLLLDDFKRIVPLIQLTQLVIECFELRHNQLVEILHHVPNVQTLILSTVPLLQKSDTSTEQDETA
ncbi:unnamed protein product [Rotaria sordida]|uniref:Uncharacterized protein n=1 Tax=Rotaria sordida TaxID=392033 RepID=A0A814QYL3_9BILA|nr:unnamed protein product [Rotaria sordida]